MNKPINIIALAQTEAC